MDIFGFLFTVFLIEVAFWGIIHIVDFPPKVLQVIHVVNVLVVVLLAMRLFGILPSGINVPA